MKTSPIRAEGFWRRPAEDEAEFWCDAPFVRTIVSEDSKGLYDGAKTGDLTHRGYASTWVEDRDQEFVDPAAFDHSLGTYLQKNPIMLWQHDQHQPIGTFPSAQVDANGLGVDGWQPRPGDKEPDWKWLAYESVKRGIVKTYSIGGFFKRTIESGLLIIKSVDLMEISVVSIPSNPDSIFEAAAKAFTPGARRPDLTQKHVSQMSQILGMKEMTDPELLLMNESQRIARYDDLAAWYVRCGKRAPEYEEWHELHKDVMASDGLASVGGNTQRVIAFMRKVNGGVDSESVPDEKSGRSISAKNEERLKRVIEIGSEAKSLIDEVLADGNTSADAGASDGTQGA